MRTKFLTLLLCGICFWISAPAQISKHAVTVKRYSDWGKGYLTIVEPYNNFIINDKIIDGWKYNTVDSAGISQEIFGGLVLEVNGMDAKDMSETEFYNIVDNTDDITMKIWQDCTIDPVNVKLVKIPYLEEFLDLDITIDDIVNQRDDPSFGRSSTSNLAARKMREKEFDATINELSDPDFDWFYVKTYDFLITGDDPLTDKKILERMVLPKHWTRDTKNPDILITIAKNADESISSTYVPPSSRIVNTGSVTTSQYNFITKRNEYTIKQYNTTIREGGYTQTTKSLNLFFELTALDTKRLDEQTPPIIWQMTYRRYVVNPAIDIFDEYRNVVREGLLPLYDRVGSTTIKHRYCKGMKLSGNLVTFVKEGSYAYNIGFREGDYIKKYKYLGHTYTRFTPNENNQYRQIKFSVRRNSKHITLKGNPVAVSPELTFVYFIDKR